MKSIKIISIVFLLSVLLSVGTMVSFRQISAANMQDGSPSKISLDYLNYLKNYQWDKAYALTADGFREKIPLSAFRMNIENSNFIEGLNSFNAGSATVDVDKATVEIPISFSNIDDKVARNYTYTLNLDKEDGFWKVSPNWEDFLSAKLEVQEPLAVFQYNNVSVTLQYVLLYTEHSAMRIRVDINNDSVDTLYWILPKPQVDGSYIKDKSTGEVYAPLSGDGIRFTKGETFEMVQGKDNEHILTAAPGTNGCIYLYFELVPENLKQFEMVLSGFSFEGNSEIWNAYFSDVFARFDIAPNTQNSQK